jgi:hypothetical protein
MRMQQSVQSETRAHETLASEPRLGVTHDGETCSSSGIVGCPRKKLRREIWCEAVYQVSVPKTLL